MPILLLLLFSLALSIGIGIIIAITRRGVASIELKGASSFTPPHSPFEHAAMFRRPDCWLAIKSRSLVAVQSALGLHNPKPCSWWEGLSEADKLFIAPPVKGWILVLGSGLPEPSDDVDRFFRFVVEVSRKLGQVQFFCANRIVHSHAWVRADGGRIVRAYAWADHTLWKQGNPTRAEKELELKCFDYGEAAERNSFGQPDAVALNVDKLPLLAARWSLDPARIDQRFLENECGIAGEIWRRY